MANCLRHRRKYAENVNKRAPREQQEIAATVTKKSTEIEMSKDTPASSLCRRRFVQILWRALRARRHSCEHRR